MNTVQVLNQLLALHGGSLPRYLTSAPPHRQQGDDKARETLRHIVDDQQMMIDKIADYVERLGGRPDLGEFPMGFTSMHDLSIDYVMRCVLTRQEREVQTIEQLSNQLDPGSQAKALVQEALGAAKAHLESLGESLSSPLQL